MSADLPPVSNGTGNISPSVNGTRTTSTSLFFNGIDATNITSNEGSLSDNISPAPETLDEVKLQTSLYDASTGRSGGGNFQLVTRSGTNDFAGRCYFTFQHEKLNATTSSTKKTGSTNRRRGATKAASRSVVRSGRTGCSSSAVISARRRDRIRPDGQQHHRAPAALGLIQGERTKENLLARFSTLNPGSCRPSRRRSAPARPTRPASPTSRCPLFNSGTR